MSDNLRRLTWQYKDPLTLPTNNLLEEVIGPRWVLTMRNDEFLAVQVALTPEQWNNLDLRAEVEKRAELGLHLSEMVLLPEDIGADIAPVN